jgi:hypothetical protein
MGVREWVTLNVSSRLSAWLLRAYRRPLGFLVGLVILPLAVVVLLTHHANVTLGRRQALQNLRMTAQLAAQAVEETLKQTLRLEQLIAAQPLFVEAVQRRDAAYLTDSLRDLLRFAPTLDQALATTPEGDVIASYPSRSPRADSLVQQEGFQGAREGGWHPSISPVHLRDQESLEKVVDVICPVQEGKAIVGVLQSQYRIEAIRSWIQRIRVEPEGFLYVVDQRNQLVVFPFQVLPGKPKVVSDWPPVAQPLPEEGAAITFNDLRSRHRWLAGIYPVPGTGWRVVAVQPELAVYRIIHQVFWPLAIVVLLLLGLILGVSVRWARLQDVNLKLLAQNTKLLKQLQQRWTLEQGKPPDTPADE